MTTVDNDQQLGDQQLSDQQRREIDAMTYEQLLRAWRFSPIGDPMFQGESGQYIADRMKEMRAQPGGDEEHVRASKAIGWEQTK